jgi:hypothetical protein
MSESKLRADSKPAVSKPTSRHRGLEKENMKVAVLYQGHDPPIFEGGVRKPLKPGGKS